MTREVLRYAPVPCPLGTLWLCASPRGLVAIELGGTEEEAQRAWRERYACELVREAVLEPYAGELARYFAGAVTRFHLPLDRRGGTAFQRRVWDALLTIPYGETRSYKWLAEQVGQPRGFRAVGLANGRNPLPIVVPCHRVVNASGDLGGYGGGPDMKRGLLRLEGALG